MRRRSTTASSSEIGSAVLHRAAEEIRLRNGARIGRNPPSRTPFRTNSEGCRCCCRRTGSPKRYSLRSGIPASATWTLRDRTSFEFRFRSLRSSYHPRRAQTLPVTLFFQVPHRPFKDSQIHQLNLSHFAPSANTDDELSETHAHKHDKHSEHDTTVNRRRWGPDFA